MQLESGAEQKRGYKQRISSSLGPVLHVHHREELQEVGVLLAKDLLVDDDHYDSFVLAVVY